MQHVSHRKSDEIHELRAEIEHLKKIERELRAEIERLRAVLQRITDEAYYRPPVGAA